MKKQLGYIDRHNVAFLGTKSAQHYGKLLDAIEYLLRVKDQKDYYLRRAKKLLRQLDEEWDFENKPAKSFLKNVALNVRAMETVKQNKKRLRK